MVRMGFQNYIIHQPCGNKYSSGNWLYISGNWSKENPSEASIITAKIFTCSDWNTIQNKGEEPSI